jgi:hypothetical protein
MGVRRSLLASMCGFLLLAAPAGAAAPKRASSFIDSVGVNIHMSYLDTAYNNWQQVRTKLVELGVKHVRDGACVGCAEQRERLLALHDAGIGVNYIMREPGSPDSIESLVDMLAGPMRATVDSVEGPNEYDHNSDPRWAAILRAYQRRLYDLVKGSASLRGVPVIGPSLISSQSYATLGDIARWVDVANIHPYAGGQIPMANLLANQQTERIVAPRRPIVATEAGYNNAVASQGGHLPVSEAAQAAYVPRLFLDFFRAGIRRTYLYELVDEWPDPSRSYQEKHFGLLRNDFSEKPAFGTLRTLLQTLEPLTPDPFRLVPLGYQIASGAPSDLRQLLLQTGPDSYSLVLWRDATVWSAGRELAVRRTTVRVLLSRGARALTVRQLTRAGAKRVAGAGRSVRVPVGGVPAVVGLNG